MRFSCSGDDLGKALRVACSAVPGRPTNAALSCVRLDAREDKLAITATNMDVQVTARLEATVDEAGSSLVNANVLRGLARPGPAEFKTDGTDLIFKGDLSSARLQTIPVEDFPTLVSEGDFKPIKSALTDILDCVKFSADDETRYFLRGVCIAPSHCVAIDGHRMVAIEGGGGDNQIIPKEAAAILSTIPDAKILLSEFMWKAKADRITAYGKLVDGVFPDWKQLIPDLTPTMEIEADDLAEAAVAISPVFSERDRRITISEKDGTICLSANGGFGSANARARSTGTLTEVGINGKYLESVCGAFSGHTVHVASDTEILLLKANGRQAVIMGMRGKRQPQKAEG